MPLPPETPGGECPACRGRGEGALAAPPPAQSEPGRERPRPGQQFGGYRIERLLGKGGMGEVFQAEQVETGRRVALKVMGHALGSEADRKRFLREGRLAASVNHPNVVYVHGSEEISGVPVIAMELVTGGTLKDRVSVHGTLPVPEAVEAMLQVIAGLEAAEAAGVLHRDIKPSNCFVAADGTIKVGDFGLSVSTLTHGESLLTTTGTVLGTPAYASPEQLRGEELNRASDIYSVGATFYHLLTGRLPFESTEIVKLITEVLDKTPPPPSAVRPEIPEQLSRLILRCLAKDRKARFASYADLRDALLPFSRAEAEPARPGPRIAAGLLDTLIASLPFHLQEILWQHSPLDLLLRDHSWSAALLWLPTLLWYFGYFTLCEGRWGAGLGKALLGLRVVGLNRDVPGFARAALRTFLFMLPNLLPAAVCFATSSGEEFRQAQAQGLLGWRDWSNFALFCLLYATLWKRFGYVALLDRLSGTRVIVRQRTQARPRLAPIKGQAAPSAAAPAAALPAARFGPYQSKAVLWQSGTEALLLAEDATLRRNVWIHLRPAEAPPVSPARRDLSRPARLRWLGGGRAPSGAWDAYDAEDGMAFTDLAAKPQSWNAVRFWLLDLTRELSTLLGELELPPVLALDRLWITKSGHALLLDFPAPSQAATLEDRQPFPLEDARDLQRFLDRVARRAMEPAELAHGPPAPGGVRAPVPLHAQGFLASLARGAFDRAEFVLGNLESLVNRPVTISRAKRFWSFALVPAVVAVVSLLAIVAVSFNEMRWRQTWAGAYPDKPSLRGTFAVYQEALAASQLGQEQGREAELARVYLVTHFGTLLTNDAFWAREELAREFEETQRHLMRQAVLAHQPPAPATVQEAERIMPQKIRQAERMHQMLPLFIAAVLILFCPWIWALIELASAVVAGKARMMDLLGLAVVDRQGRPAGRLRLLWRWLVVWAPLAFLTLLAPGFFMLANAIHSLFPFLHRPNVGKAAEAVFIALFFVVLAGILGAMVYTILRPGRALQDRLAGTWVVVK